MRKEDGAKNEPKWNQVAGWESFINHFSVFAFLHSLYFGWQEQQDQIRSKTWPEILFLSLRMKVNSSFPYFISVLMSITLFSSIPTCHLTPILSPFCLTLTRNLFLFSLRCSSLFLQLVLASFPYFTSVPLSSSLLSSILAPFRFPCFTIDRFLFSPSPLNLLSFRLPDCLDDEQGGDETNDVRRRRWLSVKHEKQDISLSFFFLSSPAPSPRTSSFGVLFARHGIDFLFRFSSFHHFQSIHWLEFFLPFPISLPLFPFDFSNITHLWSSSPEASSQCPSFLFVHSICILIPLNSVYILLLQHYYDYNHKGKSDHYDHHDDGHHGKHHHKFAAASNQDQVTSSASSDSPASPSPRSPFWKKLKRFYTNDFPHN